MKAHVQKHYFALLIMAMIAISTALMSVPVFSLDGDVTLDLTYYYPGGYVPGVAPGGFVVVDVYVDASALPDLSPEGMHGWGLKVIVDPAVLTPLAATGASAGYFLYDWSEANYPPPFPGGPMPYPPQFLSSNETDHIECSEFFVPLPPTGAGNSTGKLCTLYFTSKSETAYSPLTVDVEGSGYQDATGAKYAINAVNGHYNQPSIYTLTVESTPIDGINLTIGTTTYTSNCSVSLPEGFHTVIMPLTWTVGPDEYVFMRWEDNSTNPVRSISLTADRTITATYGPPKPHALTVNSEPITGINFTVDGATYITNWSGPLLGGDYEVTMPSNWMVSSDWYIFRHWEDFSTNPVRSISLTSNITTTATYELVEYIVIRSDGSVDPSTPLIQRDENVYTFTDNIYAGIEVQSSNIVIDGNGHTLEGNGKGAGMKLWNVNKNVTIKNMEIRTFGCGISLIGVKNVTIKNVEINTCGGGIGLSAGSDYVTVSGSNITGNDSSGISLHECWYNNFSGNNITDNHRGIFFMQSGCYNSISGNVIANNNQSGIKFEGGSRHNNIWENSIINSECGILLRDSSDNIVYHNNFVDNTIQVYSDWSTNVWDNGYPYGGNYWSDYSTRYPSVVDEFKGENQDILGSDGIWDSPYVIDVDNRDNYPGVNPWAALIPRIKNVSRTPAIPNYDEEVLVTATIIDDTAVDEALLSYTHDSTWHNVSMESFDDVFSATIPAQAYGSLVQYMIYANDTDGNWALSKIYSYTVVDTVPPEIHSVQCTSLLNIHANVTEPTSASGVDKVILHLRVDTGDWWNTTLTYNVTLGLWIRTIFGYNQLAGKAIEYFIETYDKAGNKNTSDMLNHSVDEWTIADLNRDSKVDRVDILLFISCLRRGAPLIGFAGLLIGSVVYVKRRKKKQLN